MKLTMFTRRTAPLACITTFLQKLFGHSQKFGSFMSHGIDLEFKLRSPADSLTEQAHKFRHSFTRINSLYRFKIHCWRWRVAQSSEQVCIKAQIGIGRELGLFPNSVIK